MPSIVLLLSDKRSGSTMFQDEICRHPDVQTVPYSPHSNLETHWWLTAAVLLRRPDRLFSSGRAYGGYGSRANARAYMIDLLARCVPDFQPPADDRTLVFEGWEALCQAYARPVFFEKSPQFLAHWAALSLILEWMQTTRFRREDRGHGPQPARHDVFRRRAVRHGPGQAAIRLAGNLPQPAGV